MKITRGGRFGLLFVNTFVDIISVEQTYDLLIRRIFKSAQVDIGKLNPTTKKD